MAQYRITIYDNDGYKFIGRIDFSSRVAADDYYWKLSDPKEMERAVNRLAGFTERFVKSCNVVMFCDGSPVLITDFKTAIGKMIDGEGK